MSGHSKWSTIKRKKAANDSKRSKIFSKIVKEIEIAVKSNGITDPEHNPALRLAIANANGVNMPKENIKRAIKKAGDKDSKTLELIDYEAYGPAGVGIFIECATDNQQRTVSNIRSYLHKFDSEIGKNGCLSFVFDRKGVFSFKIDNHNLEKIELDLIEAGAQEIEVEDDYVTIYTQMEDFGNMNQKLENLKINTEKAALERIPINYKKVDTSTAKSILKLIDLIEDDDDVQNVYHNLEITDEIINSIE